MPQKSLDNGNPAAIHQSGEIWTVFQSLIEINQRRRGFQAERLGAYFPPEGTGRFPAAAMIPLGRHRTLRAMRAAWRLSAQRYWR